MISLAFSSILLALTGVLLSASAFLPPAAALHVVLACAVLPLIVGAMLHFVPVLTRSAAPARPLRALPWLMQGAGVLVVGALAGWWPRFVLQTMAPVVMLALTILLVWMGRRAHRCLGSPHPGWRWYGAALALLLLGLAAVPAIDSEWGWPARLFHLHINLLGLIGLAALGTLPVLLPTTLGQPDPQAARWLRRWCGPASLAVVLIASGQALASSMPAAAWLAVGGALLMLLIASALLWHWWRSFGKSLVRDGAALSLMSALVGWVALSGLISANACAQALGVENAMPLLMPGSVAIIALLPAFLLPLVSGALSHLLPVWRYPLDLPRRREWRLRLTASARWRVACWLAAALLLFLSARHEIWADELLLFSGIMSAAALLDLLVAMLADRNRGDRRGA